VCLEMALECSASPVFESFIRDLVVVVLVKTDSEKCVFRDVHNSGIRMFIDQIRRSICITGFRVCKTVPVESISEKFWG